jgi:hypothetical protein
VHGDVVDPFFELLLGGQLAVEDQVGGLEIGAVFRQLLDRIAAVFEDALVVFPVRLSVMLSVSAIE